MSKTVKELAMGSCGCCWDNDCIHVDTNYSACAECARIERALVEHEKAVREEDAQIADSKYPATETARLIRARKPADTEEGA